MVSRTSAAPKPAATGTSRSTTRRVSTTSSSCPTATSTLQCLSEKLLKKPIERNYPDLHILALTSGKKRCIRKCLKVDQSFFFLPNIKQHVRSYVCPLVTLFQKAKASWPDEGRKTKNSSGRRIYSKSAKSWAKDVFWRRSTDNASKY